MSLVEAFMGFSAESAHYILAYLLSSDSGPLTRNE